MSVFRAKYICYQNEKPMIFSFDTMGEAFNCDECELLTRPKLRLCKHV